MSEADQEQPAFRVLVLGPFAPGRGVSDVLPVDKQGLAGAVARLAPRLDLALGSGRERLDVSLRFESLRDFEPAALLRQVPPLQAAQELRAMCAELASGELDVEGFRRAARERVPEELAQALAAELASSAASGAGAQAQPASGGASPEPSGSIDAILDLVAAPEAEPSGDTARKLAGELAGAVGRGRSRSGRPGPAGRVEALLGARVAQGLDALLAQPELRALESAWRGLAFLVERTDFREPLAIDVVSADVDDAAGALADAAAREDYDLALGAYELDASARDLERAKALGAAAMEAQTPLALGVAPEFLGVETWSGLRRAQLPQTIFAGPAYDGWRSLRGREEARWLALVANRLVLRAPYGPEGRKPRDLDYAEGGERPGCTGSALWGLGAAALRAFARTGLCIQMSGTRNGLIQDLGLVPVEGARDPLPVEGALGRERVEDLEKIGLCAADHYQRDVAYLGSLRCFRQPERYPDPDASADAVQHVTLAYQLYASRFAKFLARALPDVAGRPAEEVGAALRDAIVAFLSTKERPLDPRRVGVVTGPSADDPEAIEIKLRVGPDFKIAGRDVNVMLAFAARL